MINSNFISFDQFRYLARRINPNKVSICYYNDPHGNSDQMAGIVSGLRKFKSMQPYRDSVSFVLSAGDNYSGANVKKNKFIIDLMQNMFNVDASAVGNHEMDGGSEGFYEAAKGKKVDFIATNMIPGKGNKMPEFVKKSKIIERDGARYGFIGAMPMDLEMVSKHENTKDIKVMPFEETVKALQNEINNLKSQKVNKIILLSHSGYDEDKALASSLEGVDIIVGGHSHNVVAGAKQNENVVMSKSNEPVLIVQAGENGKYYGMIDAEFDENGILKVIKNRLLNSPTKHKSPIIEYIKEQNTGKSPKIGSITNIDPLPANRRIKHCMWTSVVADSMKEELGADIALINAANIRKVPQVGSLTENDVVESVPMKNKLVKTTVSQKQLVEAIMNASKKTMTASDGYPGLLHVSGLTYKIDDTGNLLEMNFVDKNGNKTPIDINNPSESIRYSAIYDDFTAKEGGEYPELFPTDSVQEFDYDKDKTMIDYLNKKQDKEHLDFTDDKRIEILETSQPKQRRSSGRNFLNLTSKAAS